ncbi:hypothetical protein CONCODRAFT_19751 [Conidiobolus coronatus NRRL 28638]|uniref:F-box domain-containing protein n=1 Tax=Conidiobolus coronatus (strain ATCC 28846 / CBS 209.66 / NRRL 28638) TaxID=796925 RepID=A0A137NWN5_CONC2|nr:hypothetical protein CONCODRAFT_19751 [Conidiobolus coronatus NRRL 28638]|eukprot:KXN67223.1 hypothetical protein CONCODRAFT_19751 [Conidiobolus coronatus NRRL 28638]
MLPPDFDRTLILNNPQLTWINFKIRMLNEARVAVFDLFKNIKKLELSVDRIFGVLESIKFNFPSLTSLYFYKVNSRTWKLFEKTVLSSPSLTEIEIEFNFDPDIEAPPKLIELINNIPKLQKLSIRSSKSIKFNFEDISPSTSLELLKISFDVDVIAILNKLSKIPNIKAVSFRKYFHKEYSLFNQDLKIEYWRLIDIQDNSDSYYFHVAKYNPSFVKCLQSFTPYVMSVKLKLYSNHYQLLEVSRVLRQLTILSISGIVVSLTAFNNALLNLQSLESLSIERNKFIQYIPEWGSSTSVILPSSLKNINWQRCKIYLCSLQEDPQLMKYNYHNTLSEHADLHFQIDTFTKLRKLSCFLLPIFFNTNFLLDHSKLNTFSFTIDKLDEASTSIFYKIRNINNLELNVNSMDLNLNLDMISLSLCNLTSVEFYAVKANNWPIFEKVVLSSPNLAELKVNFIHSVYHFLIELINTIPSLQKLVINSLSYKRFDIEYLKSSSSLKYLEIGFDTDIVSTLLKLSNYSSLKTVIFSKKFYDDYYLSTFNHGIAPFPWKLINIGAFLRYYK